MCKDIIRQIKALYKTYVKYLISFTIFMLILRYEFTYHRIIRNY